MKITLAVADYLQKYSTHHYKCWLTFSFSFSFFRIQTLTFPISGIFSFEDLFVQPNRFVFSGVTFFLPDSDQNNKTNIKFPRLYDYTIPFSPYESFISADKKQ